MKENKTQPTGIAVTEFLQNIENETRKSDALIVFEIMKEIFGEEPVMWGDSIVGFGNYHYKYTSGREGDWFKTGFSPRKKSLTLYFMCNIQKQAHLLKKLGKHKIGKGCLYINKIRDINLDVLKEIITESLN